MSIRGTGKKLVQCVAAVLTWPLAWCHRHLGALDQNHHLFSGMAEGLSLIPGRSGSYLRAAFYSQAIPGFSREVFIGFGSFFPHPTIEVEAGVYVGAYNIIGRVRLEQNTTIGSHVDILSGRRQHNFEELDKPVQEQGGHFQKVIIGENTWIGNGAIVMANVGKQCVVGAGTVVIKDTGDYEVLVGNPARVVKTLKPTENAPSPSHD